MLLPSVRSQSSLYQIRRLVLCCPKQKINLWIEKLEYQPEHEWRNISFELWICVNVLFRSAHRTIRKVKKKKLFEGIVRLRATTKRIICFELLHALKQTQHDCGRWKWSRWWCVLRTFIRYRIPFFRPINIWFETILSTLQSISDASVPMFGGKYWNHKVVINIRTHSQQHICEIFVNNFTNDYCRE